MPVDVGLLGAVLSRLQQKSGELEWKGKNGMEWMWRSAVSIP